MKYIKKKILKWLLKGVVQITWRMSKTTGTPTATIYISKWRATIEASYDTSKDSWDFKETFNNTNHLC